MSVYWFISRQKCPACSSEEFINLYSRKFEEDPIRKYLIDFYGPQGGVEFEYLTDESYILCQCVSCKLIFQRDIPNDQLMTRLYEKWIDPSIVRAQQMHGAEYYTNISKEIISIVKHSGKNPKDISVLDFGMGWGEWALMAKAFGCKVYGTELSITRIDYAKANGLIVLDWNDIQDYKFDYINTEQVFEHLSDPLDVLKYLRSALKRNGVIKISVPGAKDIKRRLKIMSWEHPKGSKNSLNAVAPLEHINCFKWKSLLKMATVAEMIPVSIPRTTFIYWGNWEY